MYHKHENTDLHCLKQSKGKTGKEQGITRHENHKQRPLRCHATDSRLRTLYAQWLNKMSHYVSKFANETRFRASPRHARHQSPPKAPHYVRILPSEAIINTLLPNYLSPCSLLPVPPDLLRGSASPARHPSSPDPCVTPPEKSYCVGLERKGLLS